MPIESASYVSQLDANNPVGTDDRSTLDNQDRLIKQVLVNTFNDLRGPVSASAGEMNFLVGVTANLQTQLNDTNSLLRSTSAVLRGELVSLSGVLMTNLSSDIHSLSSVLQTRITNDLRSTSAAIQTVINTLTYYPGGTDVAVADGGTGASTAADARTNLGLGTAAVVNITTFAETFISTQTISSAATANITSGIDATYNQYIIRLLNFIPATNGAILQLNYSNNGGASYIISGYVNENSATTTYIDLSGGVGVSNVTANGGVTIDIVLQRPASTSLYKYARVTGNYYGTGIVSLNETGSHPSTNAVDAINVQFTTGNIASGIIQLIGKRVS